MEAYFIALSQDPELPGYGEFEKEAWAFKVCIGALRSRVSEECPCHNDGPHKPLLSAILYVFSTTLYVCPTKIDAQGSSFLIVHTISHPPRHLF